MKKFLKILIIVLLVAAAVCATVFVFFRQKGERDVNTGSIVAYIGSIEKKTFNSNMETLSNNVKAYNANDTRFDFVEDTSDNLDTILETLITYYMADDTNIADADIKSQFESVKASRARVDDMYTEFDIKKDSKWFARDKGANDIYRQISDYLVKYADLVNLINADVQIANKNVDIKFAMFEIYANVVSNTFKEFETDANQLVSVKKIENIDLLNDEMFVQNSYIESAKAFTSTCNDFIKYYNQCDKQEFAKNLAGNVEIDAITEDSSNIEKATYYLKSIYGLI
ncbi:MAG: hypothetical protein E7351_00305 [Clostridiales bacterium]|nr:hypothetical protein [Clostridiales bacterium]